MDAEKIKTRIPVSEIRFSTTRSSGPGGQNVNKVNTRVELRFNVHASKGLTVPEKEMISRKLKNKITSSGDLIVTSQSERSQLMNRKKAEEKFYKLLAAALIKKKKRKKTKPTNVSIQKRLDAKKKRSRIKELRRGSA